MLGTFIAGAFVGMLCYWLGFTTAAIFAAKGRADDYDRKVEKVNEEDEQ